MPGLTAEELLRGAYMTLESQSTRKIALSVPARSSLTRLGERYRSPEFSGYSSVIMTTRPKHDGRASGWWAVAMGQNCAPHVHSRFSCEIVAVPVSIAGRGPEEIDRDIRHALGCDREHDFYNTLVAAYTDGSLYSNPEGRFGRLMTEFFKGLDKMTIQKAKISSPPATDKTRPSTVLAHASYKTECTAFLFASICKTLAGKV